MIPVSLDHPQDIYDAVQEALRYGLVELDAEYRSTIPGDPHPVVMTHQRVLITVDRSPIHAPYCCQWKVPMGPGRTVDMLGPIRPFPSRPMRRP